jgi:hypothetical protein
MGEPAKSRDRLLAELLSLPDEERWEIADTLLASLGREDDRTNEEWLSEVERRARRALAGEPGVPWEKARAQLGRRFGAF